uniref:hypothetical protein n=1 Tax=uncultured Alsobacter sp. TaxID=1748258 RepID=UPI0025F05A25
MDMTSSNQRFVTRRLPVPVGLHVLRYVSSADPKRPPVVIVAPKPDEADGLDIVFAPGATHDVLERVGDCVVIRALRAAAVLVTTASHVTARSDDVELRMERLDAVRDAVPAPVPAPVMKTASAVSAPAADPHAGIFEIQGHVQRRGDCAAGPDGWLGAAGAVDRIEAFGVAWQRPAPGLRLHYGCTVEDGTQHVAKLPGQLVGSRGRSLGIAEVRFELGGKRASEFELVVSVSFQGGAVRTVAGRQIALAGPTGSERITGLRVGLREIALALPAPERSEPARPAAPAARPQAAVPA